MLSTLRRYAALLREKDGRLSFSQTGEDLIIEMAFSLLGINQPYYLDLGAHHPTHLSNTYYFYRRGAHGVCVEADPTLCAAIAAKRPRDKCLNIGVGAGESTEADFYIMSTRSLNTFSRAEAERYAGYGKQTIDQVVRVPLLDVNEIIARHCERVPDLVSLDIEGLDLQVVERFDFARYQPAVFCVETLTYTEDRTETKVTEIIARMQAAGYLVMADTYINTVFVRKDRWSGKP